MPAEITMPQLSDTMTEGTVIKWHKNEGDTVRAGDVVVRFTLPHCARSLNCSALAVRE